MSDQTSAAKLSDRAAGALWGIALGDALGMPTQAMSPQHISTFYGKIRRLRGSVTQQPIAPLMPAGSVTDDTEQALLIARLLVESDGTLDPVSLAKALIDWEADMRRRGSLDLLGPTTKRALDRVAAGEDPLKTGRDGITNGAAMRVAPIGIAVPLTNLDRFSETVYASIRVTHDTVQGWEGSALIAAAVSAAIDGADAATAVRHSIDIVAELPARGHWQPVASVLARAQNAVDTAVALDDGDFLGFVRNSIGTSIAANESVPAALAVAARYAESPFEGLCAAANLGGDTDTIAAMAGAVLGAAAGREQLPEAARELIAETSQISPDPLAEQLVALRASPE